MLNVPDRDEHLDLLASAENRRDTRRAMVMSALALATVLGASVLLLASDLIR